MIGHMCTKDQVEGTSTSAKTTWTKTLTSHGTGGVTDVQTNERTGGRYDEQTDTQTKKHNAPLLS